MSGPIAETLSDLLSPDDCPAGVVTTARGLIRAHEPPRVVDCVMAYRPKPDWYLSVVMRETEGGPWHLTMGFSPERDGAVLDALEACTRQRDYGFGADGRA